MLTDKAIQAAKARFRPYKLADGEGLTLLVKPNGSKLWRFRYRHDGREKMLGFGIYPDTSAKLAREKRDKARKQLAEGLDPSSARQAEVSARANTFEAVAREWLPMQKERLASATYDKAVWTLETLVFPYLGTRPVDKIGASDVLKVLKRIEGRGLHETAHRTRQRISQVCRYAVITERAQHDVTARLRGALAPVATSNHAAIIEPGRIGELLLSTSQASPRFSTHLREREDAVKAEMQAGALKLEPGYSTLLSTRRSVQKSWRNVAEILDSQGQSALAGQVERFLAQMPPPMTEKQHIANRLAARARENPMRSPPASR